MIERRGEIVSLQAVRAVAATAVVYHHALRAATLHRPLDISLLKGTWQPTEWWVNLGSLGVDVFFVLSGFLMVYISPPYFSGVRTTLDFLIKRFLRIWPLYAVFTSYAVIRGVWASRPHFSAAFDVQPVRLLSYVFIPSYNQAGLIAPPVGVGWTLTYEVFFYLSFALVIALKPKSPITALAVVIGLLYVLSLLCLDTALGSFLHNSLIFEFLLGSWIGAIYIRGWQPKRTREWMAASVLTLMLMSLVPSSIGVPRFITGGLPAALMFIGVLAVSRSVRYPLWLTKLGAASYAIYLSHIFVAGAVVDRVLSRIASGNLGKLSVLIASLCAIAVCLVVGVIVHEVLERPLLRFFAAWESRLKGRDAKPSLAARE